MRRVQTCRCHHRQQPTQQHLRLMQQPVKQLLRQRLMPRRLRLLQSNYIKSV
jgi:hypothetical protein